jgi:hypothetical protein
LADTNFPSEKNFEVENFQLLTMMFSENFLSVEIFLEWKWALRNHAILSGKKNGQQRKPLFEFARIAALKSASLPILTAD